MNDEFRRLESVVLYISPGSIADGGVRLPIERTNVAELSSLEVEDAGVLLHGVILVVDHADVVFILH